MKKAVSVLIILFLFGLNSCKDKSSNQLESRLEPVIQDVMKQQGIPGLAIAVVEGGKIIFERGYGVKNITNPSEGISENSLFHMASVTKMFVAAAVMQLVEQGKVDLDSSVVHYLPYFKMKTGNYAGITVRQMLSHTAGMPDERNYDWDKPQFDDGALERYVRSLSDRSMIAEPGSTFEYSNTAYEVLGDMISKVSGTTFENYVQENILTPLGMSSSTLLLKQTDKSLLTAPHVLDSTYEVSVSDVFPYNRAHSPSSTLYSNVHEMSRWMIASMNSGELDGSRILSRSGYELMWKPVSEQWQEAGLGCFLGEYRGYKTVGHSGGDVGFASNLVMIPEKSLGVVVVSNFQRAAVRQITYAALDAALHLDQEPLKGIINLQLDQILYKTIIGKGAEAAAVEYHALKEKADPPFDFNQVRQLISLGGNLIKQKRFEDAVMIYKLNVEAYPSMTFLYRYLAGAYLLNGDRESAVKTYEKILELNPGNKQALDKLNELKDN